MEQRALQGEWTALFKSRECLYLQRLSCGLNCQGLQDLLRDRTQAHTAYMREIDAMLQVGASTGKHAIFWYKLGLRHEKDENFEGF